MTRKGICVGAIVVSLMLLTGVASAETWAVKPKPSRHRKLSPELDLLRHCDSRFKGFSKKGKAVFDVASAERKTMQTMSVSMDTEETTVRKKAKRLLIRYEDQSHKPSQETLQAAGLKTVEDYEARRVPAGRTGSARFRSNGPGTDRRRGRRPCRPRLHDVSAARRSESRAAGGEHQFLPE